MPNAQSQQNWSVLALIDWTTQFFEKRNIESARLQAQMLLSHVLGWKRIDLYTKFDYVVPADKLAEFKKLIIERSEHKPIQYVLGKCDFHSLEFAVSPAVLIPRPETELLVDAVVARAKTVAGAKVLDVGTGSGCIAVTAAKLLPEAECWATDVSADALAVAAGNAKRHDVASRIHFLQGDLLEPVSGLAFDFIVSNPPYVSESEWAGLAPEVRDHEPRGALVGGPDGLDVYRRLVPDAVSRLAAGGRLILELAAGRCRPVQEIAEAAGLRTEEVIPDLQKIERVLVLAKK